MKNSSLLVKICSIALISALAVSIAACSSKDKKEKKPAESEVEPSVEMTTTTAAPTTTVPTFSGPDTNDITISWDETALTEPTVKYVKCNEFVNVRKGPGTDYEAVAKFTNNMQVIVVATTANGWSKTQDGYYVSSELLTDIPS